MVNFKNNGIIRRISWPDVRFFFIGAFLYTFLLMIALVFNTKGLAILEEIFNFIKLLGGIYLARQWIKNWSQYKSSIRMSFTTFNISVALLAIYNIYRTTICHIDISYVFNFSYHFVVIALYLGQLSMLRENCGKVELYTHSQYNGNSLWPG